MLQVTNIFVTLLSAGLFAWAVPLTQLFGAFQPLIVAISIMIAAVFVRLNRGMPSLEWKSLDPEKRKELTSAILNMTIEYCGIIGINAISLAVIVTLLVLGKPETLLWSDNFCRIVSGTIGFLISLCTIRMAYVVWRDIDIVRLQKHLIDDAASKEIYDREREIAAEKVANIRSANIQPVKIMQPKAWGD